ncbi:unnamed protein product, partial [Allacma fusca]
PVEAVTTDLKLSYDPEWLAILRSTDALLQAKSTLCYMPNETGSHRFDYSPTAEEITDVNEILEGNFSVPDNFSQTAKIYVEGQQPERAFPVKVGLPKTITVFGMPAIMSKKVAQVQYSPLVRQRLTGY